MSSYLKKGLIYLLCVFVILFAVDYIITNGLRKTGYNDFEKLAGVFGGSINSELIILGGSDAKQHFSPLVLDSALHLDSYNLGLAGHNFLMQYALFQNYLEHNQYPKVIIQTLNPVLLDKREDLYNYQLFLPYLNEQRIAKYTKEYIGLEFADYYLPFVRYSGELDLIKIGFNEFFGLRHYKNTTYKGYYSYDDRPWNEEVLTKYKKSIILQQEENAENISHLESSEKIFCPDLCFHKESVKLFENFLEEIKKNDSKIIFVNPPTFIEAQLDNKKQELVMNYFTDLASKHDILLLDYSKDSLVYSKKNFYDFAHLNRGASVKFSEILAADIKNKSIVRNEEN